MADESFFEGLDDAEDIPAPEVPPEAAAPEAAAKPDAAPAEKPESKATEAAKPADKTPDKPEAKAPEVVAPEAGKAEAKPAAPEQPDPRKWVPVGAHVELRDQLKQLRAELDAIKNPPKPKPAEPDFVQDPKGYVDHRVQSALEKLDEAVKPVTQTAEAANAQASEARFHMALNAAEQSYVSRQPDYYNALAYLREARAADIRMLNPDISPQDLAQAISREEIQLAGMLMQSGRNPSEVAYGLAVRRGYSPPKPAEAPRAEPKPAAPEKVAELLPKVPETPKLAPDLTLGTGTGSPQDSKDIEEDPFDGAWKELFGRKRA